MGKGFELEAYKCKKPKIGDTIKDEQFHIELQKFQEVQDKLVKINEKASEEVLEVEQEYNKVQKPVYDKRNDIIKSIFDFWPTANFSPNSYFEDTKLTKTFTFLDEGTTKITATPIKWKEGMGFSNGVTHEKDGNKLPHKELRLLKQSKNIYGLTFLGISTLMLMKKILMVMERIMTLKKMKKRVKRTEQVCVKWFY